MRKLFIGTATLSSVLLMACTPTLPTGPSVAVMPGKEKSFETFQNDNAMCMQFARSQIGINPQQQSDRSVAAGAVTGTILGAAAGAALGDSSRAAGIGAGAGLLVGAAAGNNNAVRSTRELQSRYDLAYQQCMYAKGNQLPRVAHYRTVTYPAPAYYPPPPYYRSSPYDYPPPPRYPEPGYYPPPPPPGY